MSSKVPTVHTVSLPVWTPWVIIHSPASIEVTWSPTITDRYVMYYIFSFAGEPACIGAHVKAGSGLGHDQRHTRPAD